MALHGKKLHTTHLLAGSVTTWDPRIDPGLQIRGRVLDDVGAPRAGLIVQAEVQGHERGQQLAAVGFAGQLVGGGRLAGAVPGAPVDAGVGGQERVHPLGDGRERGGRGPGVEVQVRPVDAVDEYRSPAS